MYSRLRAPLTSTSRSSYGLLSMSIACSLCAGFSGSYLRPRSSSRTLLPALAQAWAKVAPPAPPPTTITSQSYSMGLMTLEGRGQKDEDRYSGPSCRFHAPPSRLDPCSRGPPRGGTRSPRRGLRHGGWVFHV